MNSFEKITLYILSFLLYPIGIITWIISLFSNDLEKKEHRAYLSLHLSSLIRPFLNPWNCNFPYDCYF